jgi:hypothetical protein
LSNSEQPYGDQRTYSENCPGGAETTVKRKFLTRVFCGLLLWAAFAGLAGCGVSHAPPAPPAPIRVAVAPGSPSLQAGQAQAFTANVSNASNKAVLWSLSGAGCTDANCGTLDSASANPVTYTAPATVPTPATITLTAASGGDASKSASANITVTVPTITITVTPKLSAVVISTQKQQFTAQVANDPNRLGVSWAVDSIAGGNSTVGSITTAGVYTPPAVAGTHSITAASLTDHSKSASANIAVSDLAGVFTFHNNLSRDGTNSQEYALSASSVKIAAFGKLFSCPVDGAIYTQPLWVPALTIGGEIHNVIFVATQHDSLYAFDADANPCVQLWHVSLVDSAHGGTTGEVPVPAANVGYYSQNIQPEIGVTSTPVIDPGTATIYVLGKSINASTTFFQRLHALAMTTGAEKFNAPVSLTASLPGTGDGGSTVSFDLQTQLQRSALALVNVNGSNVVYVASASHEDRPPFHGWVLGYAAGNVSQQAGVFNTTANSGEGGIWMSGGAPAADGSGNLFLATSNGQFDGDSSSQPNNNDFGDSVLKLDATTNLTVTDWFTPDDQLNLANYDLDLGSGGVTLFPDQPTGPVNHLLVSAGKEGLIYLINRDNMGQYHSSNNNQIVQSFSAGTGSFGTPAFWQNNLYYAGAGGTLQRFEFDPTSGQLSPSPSSQSSHSFPFPGATASISSQAASNGIAWVLDTAQYGDPSLLDSGPAVLYAYDATDLTIELWDSSQAAGHRDQAGDAVKCVPPTVANGKVYVSTRSEIDVYGLLPN